MEHTEYYHLPQWEDTDRIMHDDFNNAFAALDAALAQKADSAALSAILADYGNCRIWTTTYTGNGQYGEEHPTVIDFPAQPLLVYIRWMNDMGANSFILEPYGQTYAFFNEMTERAALAYCCPAVWSENRLSFYNTSANSRQMNQSGATYRVVALIAADA